MTTARDPRYDVLFESVQIGPVTARNRFFQVPHCNGMGYRDPSALAAMRGMKAEGGWAVIATEETEIHPSSDVAPYIEGRIWDDRDIPAHLLVTGAIHEHGSLAAIELVHSGMAGNSMYTRIPPMGPSHRPTSGDLSPIQARRMDRQDIADLRRWYREATVRSLEAGYDIVYVYAGHNLSTLQHFLSPRYNDRADEYGGSLENRARLLREVLEDTLEVVDGRAGVACRIVVDELIGSAGFTRDEMVELLSMIGELPDVWDFMVGAWPDDSVTSRFGPESEREDLIRGLKDLTSKPVVGVGRFTSPDAMVSQIKRGVLDMIGAARPSIADPFLPNKIKQGNIDDIRECIGCNICVSGDNTMTPIRCTQNPTMGEEWRRDWHPEIIAEKKSEAKILVVGSGPAGLECTRALGHRGYDVVLAEATTQLGGRVSKESQFPGLAAWARVRDYRVGQIETMPNVEVFLDSPLEAGHVEEFAADHVVLATGSHWRRDGVGRANTRPISGSDKAGVLTPDDIINGAEVTGPVLVFDDDHFYMGGIMAELLRGRGLDVTLVTPATEASAWTRNTLEQVRIQKRLLEIGVSIITAHNLVAIHGDNVELACIYSGRITKHAASSVVMVTMRLPNDDLYLALASNPSVTRIGDALAPATIAHAVYAGHRFARELDEPLSDGVPFKRELASLGDF